MGRLERWQECDELRQTTPGACVFLTVRFLAQYGLLLENKRLVGDCRDIGSFEHRMEHQGGPYSRAISHFKTSGVCPHCYQSHLDGDLHTQVFDSFSAARNRIVFQLEHGFPIVFTLQYPPPDTNYHSYVVIETTNSHITFINPHDPPLIVPQLWDWFEREWNGTRFGGKDLAWYEPKV